MKTPSEHLAESPKVDTSAASTVAARGPLGYPLFAYHLGRTVQWGHWGITFMDRQPDERMNFGLVVGTLPFPVGAAGPVDGTVGSDTRLRLKATCDAWVRDATLPDGLVRPEFRWPEFMAPKRIEDFAPVAASAGLSNAQIDLIANDGMRNAAGGIYATRVYEFAHAIEAEATRELVRELRGLRDMILDTRELRHPDKAERMRCADAAIARATGSAS